MTRTRLIKRYHLLMANGVEEERAGRNRRLYRYGVSGAEPE